MNDKDQDRWYDHELAQGLQLAKSSSLRVLTSSLCTLAHHLSGLVSTETATPVTTLLLVLVSEVGLGGGDEGCKLALILAVDILKSEDSSGLLVDDGAETCFALDDDVGNTHLAAKSREEDNQLNGVDVVGNDDEGRLLCLDEGDTVVQTILNEKGLLVLGRFLSLSGSFGQSLKTLLLLDLALWAVLVEELEKLRSSVLVQSVGELGNSGGNLQALGKNDLLALKTDVLRPLDEASEIGLRTNVLTNAEVLGLGLEEWVFCDFCGFASSTWCGCGLLAGTGLSFGGHFYGLEE